MYIFFDILNVKLAMVDKKLLRKWLLSGIELRMRWIQLDSHEFFNSWTFRKCPTLYSQARHCLLQFHQSQQTVILFNHVMDLILVQNSLDYVASSRNLVHFDHWQRDDVTQLTVLHSKETVQIEHL